MQPVGGFGADNLNKRCRLTCVLRFHSLDIFCRYFCNKWTRLDSAVFINISSLAERLADSLGTEHCWLWWLDTGPDSFLSDHHASDKCSVNCPRGRIGCETIIMWTRCCSFMPRKTAYKWADLHHHPRPFWGLVRVRCEIVSNYRASWRTDKVIPVSGASKGFSWHQHRQQISPPVRHYNTQLFRHSGRLLCSSGAKGISPKKDNSASTL